MTTALVRDAGINALCPPHRVDSDELYAERVLNVVSTLPARDVYYLRVDLDSWDAWTAEATKVRAWRGVTA